jgi:hypothetical protein
MPNLRSHKSACSLALLAALATSACDNSDQDADVINGDPTPEQLAALEAATTLSSGFGTLSNDGTFIGGGIPVVSGGFTDTSTSGFAYQVERTGTNFSAVAAIVPGSTASPLPGLGIATLTGIYQGVEIGKSDPIMGREFGEALQNSGRIQLRADFASRTLEGSSGPLNVQGTFNNSTLQGRVFYNENEGTLTGLIGGDKAIGAFHGFNGNIAFSGGFHTAR